MELIKTQGIDSDELEFAFDLQRFAIDDTDSDFDEPSEDDDFIYNEDDNEIIDALGGNDTIANSGDKVSINGGAGNDVIKNAGDNVTLEGGEGNDDITNDSGKDVVIRAGAGDDYVDNSGSNVTIDASDGYDIIYNSATNVTINAGAGDDNITNSGNKVSVNGGTGNDLILVSGNSNTVNVGEGNDTIIIDDEEDNVGILTVENFGVGDVIVLAKAVDSLEKSGRNVTAGDLTIRNLGKTATEKGWVLNEKGAAVYADITTGKAVLSDDGKTIVYSNARATSDKDLSNALVTIEGVTSTEGLSIDTENKTVTVSASALSQNSIVKIKSDEDYKLVLADDVVQNVEYSEEGWRLNGTTASYVNGSTTEGYKLNEDSTQISYQSSGTGKTLVVVNGVTSTENLVIDNEAKTVTVPADCLREDLVVTANNDYTLALGDDVSGTGSRTGSWRFSGSTATYVKGNITEGYVLENNQIFYESRATGAITTVVKVEGVTSRDGLIINETNKTVTISESSLGKDSTVTISDDYTLALADGVTRPSAETVEWSLRGTNAIGNISAATGGYKLSNNQISYVEAGENSRVIVAGVVSTEGLSLEDKVVKVSLKSLESEGSVIDFVTVSPGYTLTLGEDVFPPTNMGERWSARDNAVNYTSSSRLGGYALENNQITYYPDRNEKEELTINGVNASAIVSDDGNSATGITRNGNTFTISAAALVDNPNSDTEVRISEGYSLALGEDVTAPKRIPAGWERNETTAIYKTSATQPGYELSEGNIVYREEITASGVVTVTGVNPNDIDGLYFDGDDSVVTVYKSALLTDGTEMTISDDYTFELADDVDMPTAKENWNFDGNKATYQEGGFTAGHRLSDGKIVYESEIAGEVKLGFEGISALPTIVSDAENPEKLTVQFTDDNIVNNVSVTSNEGGFDFEILEGTYSEGEFAGSADKDTITNHGEYLAINGGAGVDRIINDGANVSIDGGLGSDRINNTGTNVIITGGKGNDNITLSGETGGNTFIYNVGDGNDFIDGFSSSDTIRIIDDSGDSIQAVANIKGDDVVIKIGSGSITFRKAVSKETAFDNVRDSNNAAIAGIAGNKYTANGVINDDKILLSSTFDSIYTANDVEIVDGSQATKGISIAGGAKGLSLVGGIGKDTLISGETDGFELTGGKGNDVFVFKGGKGAIADYSQKGKDGKDKISLGGGLTLENFKDYEITGNNVILNFGDGNELTLREGLDKYITFGTTRSTIRTFKADDKGVKGVFDEKGKSVTLASDQDNFTATRNYSKVESIDGSLANEISITGNKKANLIIAGKENSTLSGGKGKDTLVGGGGNDIFVYDAKAGTGNKLIQNYGEDDKISLTGGGTLSEVKTKGDDLELKVGNNKITIAGGKGNSFTFIENGDEKIFTADGLLVSGKTASLTASFIGNEFKMADYDDYTSVNAGLLKKPFNLVGDSNTSELIGGKGNDSLTAGSSGSSLWGGKGNDSLIGGAGLDKFIFRAGEGVDSILDYNFDNGDELKIQDKRGKDLTYKKAINKAVFSDDTLTLSIKGGGKVIFENVHSGDNIKINNETHTISGKKLN